MTEQLPSKHELKKLVNENKWYEIGKIFGFTPIFHFSGRNFIDWRCVPQSVLDILQPDHFIKNKIKDHKKKLKYGKDERPILRRRSVILYEEQSGICHYCKQRVDYAHWSVDHRLPRFRGGSTSKANLIGSCKFCNTTKSCLTEEEFFELEPTVVGIELRARAAVKQIQKINKRVIVSRIETRI